MQPSMTTIQSTKARDQVSGLLPPINESRLNKAASDDEGAALNQSAVRASADGAPQSTKSQRRKKKKKGKKGFNTIDMSQRRDVHIMY